MSVRITFEAHATTFDNEAKKASGWYDVQLSPQGRKEAAELGERYRNKRLDAVFCSDLGRSFQTAAIAFGGDPLSADPRIVYMDWRLRECDYGKFTHKPSSLIEEERPKRVKEPFPNGESYEDAARRIKSFLNDLKQGWDDNEVLIIGHRATHYALDHWIGDMPLEEAVAQKFVWQPGWKYELDNK